MIRITELRLPIHHAPEDIEAAILKRLNLSAKELISFTIFKRSYDARKNVALAFIYTIDLSVKSATNLYMIGVTAVANGSFNITFYTTGGTATDAPVFNFGVTKGSAQ